MATVDEIAIQTRLSIEQARLVIVRSPITLVMGTTLAIIAAAMLWPRATSRSALLVWVGLLSTAYVARIVLRHYFQQAEASASHSPQRWSSLIVFLACFTGVVWGTLPYMPLTGDTIDNVALIGFLLGGISSSGVTTLAAHRTAAYAFVIPCLAPIVVRLFSLPGDIAFGMGVMVTLYSLVSVNAIRQANRDLIDNIRLRLDSEEQQKKMAIGQNRLQEQQKLNAIIGAAQSNFIRDMDLRTLFASLLDDLLKVTRCEHGLIGEVLQDANNGYRVKTHAASSVNTLEYRALSAHCDAALASGNAIMGVEPMDVRHSNSSRDHHPEFQSFLAAPAYLGDKMLGVVSLANRSGHFDSEFLEFLAPLLSTVGQIINANRSERARRTAEQKLDLTGAQLTAFIAHTPAAVAMFDRNLNFLAFSRRWCTDFALASDAIAGKHLYSVLPDFPELWRNAYQRALQGEVQSEEADPYIGSGGTVRWFRWEARPWYDNANRSGSDTSGIILFCEDVTDSKRAADALHARDRLLSKLSARIPGMLFQLRTQIAEQKMSLLFVSEGARELYGKSPEDLSDDPRHLFRVIHPDDRVLAEAAIANAAQDCTLLTIEHRIVVADKPERWIHVEAALERLADASIIWHGYVQDITDRKRSEQRIAELAQAVRRVQGEMNLGGL